MRRIRHRLGLGHRVRPMKWLARALGLPVVMAIFAVSAQPALAQHGINPPPAPAPAPAPAPPPAPAPAPGPTIASFSPTSGPTGSTVTITGTGLASTLDVLFSGGFPASFTVVSDTTLKAVVPALATTGPIHVITNFGTGNVFSTAVFTVTNAPPPTPTTLISVMPGLPSLNPGQTAAGLALGMTPAQVMRRVVLPQAVIRVIPPMATMWVGLFKDTAILSAIGVIELMFRAREIATDTYRPLEIFTVVAVLYFVLTYPQSLVVNALYRRFRTQE